MSFLDDSDDGGAAPRTKLFGRERPIRDVLGGGKVADVLLWRDIKVSAAILAGIGLIWFLFEVVEYTLLTLLCHIFITLMLVIFIWSTGAEIFKWKRPDIPDVFLDESTFKETASIFHMKFNNVLSNLLYIACGKDIKLFFLAMVALMFLSLVGNYVSSMNLLFLGILCLETLPFLYERFEEEVDFVAGKANRRMNQLYKKFDSNVLEKIPRGPKKDS